MANNNRMWSGNRSKQDWDDEDFYNDNNRSSGNVGGRSNWDDTYGDVGYNQRPGRGRSGTYDVERAPYGNYVEQVAYGANANSGRNYRPITQYGNTRNNPVPNGYNADYAQGNRGNAKYGGRNQGSDHNTNEWSRDEVDSNQYAVDYNEDNDNAYRGAGGQGWGRYRGVSHDTNWVNEHDYRDNYGNGNYARGNHNIDRDNYITGNNYNGRGNQAYGRVRNNTNRNTQYSNDVYGYGNQNYNQGDYRATTPYGTRDGYGNRYGSYNIGRSNISSNRGIPYGSQGRTRNAFGSVGNRGYDHVNNRNNYRNVWERTKEEVPTWHADDATRRRRQERK